MSFTRLSGDRVSHWIVSKAGREWDLGQYGIDVIAYDGLDMPEIEGFHADYVGQDGLTDLGYRLKPRHFALKVRIEETPENYHDARRALIEIFRPERVESELRFVLRDQSEFAIRFRVTGPMLDDDGRAQGTRAIVHTAVVSCLATDPTFYSPYERTVSFYPLRGEDNTTITGMPVPLPVPVVVGPSVYNRAAIILYAGSYPSRPRVRIHGPITNPVIENVTTGERLPFTAEGGLVLVDGHWIDIDLGAGIATAVDHNGNYVDGYLSEENDLASFHIGYAGEIVGSGDTVPEDGRNVIRLIGEGMTTSTRVDLRYYERFIGV